MKTHPPDRFPPVTFSATRGDRTDRTSPRSLPLVAILWAWVTGLALLSVRADDLSPLWQIAPGDRAYMTTGNTERGLAFNPANRHVLLASRAGGLNGIVLDAVTGAELNLLNVDGISGGTFALNLIGVSDDGVVYAGNLSTSTTAPVFKLYRWANDQADTVPTVAFEGDPGGVDATTGTSLSPQRWGDSFDVRGAGANTQIVIASRASTHVAVFTTTDGVNFSPKLIAGAGASSGTLGVTFGVGNSLWIKSINEPLRNVNFNFATGQATLVKQYADPGFPNTVTAINVNPLKKWLGGVAIATPDHFRLYDISTPGDVVLVDQENFPADNANANNTAAVDFGSLGTTNAVFALDSNNGLVAYRIVGSPANPPVIATQPQSQTVLEGGSIAFSVVATGTTPFRYQWQFNESDLPGATNSTLTLANLPAAQVGDYRVVISNVAGTVTSANAALTVNAMVRSDALTPLWRIAPGDRPYVNTDNTQRGITSNPKNGNVIVVSRTGANKIYVLDGSTGKELRQLNTDPAIIQGGTLILNMIAAANDGAIYAGNLVTDSAAASLAIYRWENDSAEAVPTVAFLGDPSAGDADATNRRFGDTLDVRGAGVATQILLGARAGQIAAILTTGDGSSFTSAVIRTDVSAGDIGLGLAFGAGNSFWGTASARPLRLIDFDLAAGTGTTRHSFGASDLTTAITAIAVDPVTQLLAGVTLETPDTMRLYNLADLPNAPKLLDQEAFPTDNANINGTGSADFGGGRLYALDSNNGIVAFTVKSNPATAAKAANLSAPSVQPNRAFQFTITGTPGGTYVLEISANLTAWAAISTNILDAGGSAQITDASASASSATSRYYRAVAR